MALVVAALQRPPGAVEDDREVAGDRATVEVQEREAQPSARGGPARDVGVEAGRLGLRRDRGAALALPARCLDAQQLLERRVEPVEALVEAEGDLALRLQGAQAPAQAAAAVARQAALVVLE